MCASSTETKRCWSRWAPASKPWSCSINACRRSGSARPSSFLAFFQDSVRRCRAVRIVSRQHLSPKRSRTQPTRRRNVQRGAGSAPSMGRVAAVRWAAQTTSPSSALRGGQKRLGWQSWLARLLFQGGPVGIRVAAEAGAQGPGLPAVVETLAEFGPSLVADPTQLAQGGWSQPRRRGRDQAHLPSELGGRGGRLAPAGSALVVALRAEQMLEIGVGARQAGYRVTNEQPGSVAAGHLAEVPDGVGERPRRAAVPVHGGDEPVEAALDKAGVFLAPVVQDVRGPVHPAVGARDVRP